MDIHVRIHKKKYTNLQENVDLLIGNIVYFPNTAKTAQDKEIASLQEFAESRGFELQLEAWDVPYWRRKQKRHLFKSVWNSFLIYMLF